MAKQVVNIGDSGTAAKNKINGNFDELYEKAEQLGNQADIKAKVSASDDQSGYLAEKIVTPAKTLSIGTAGGNGAAQTLSVDVHVSILTRLVKMWDRTLNYRGMTWPGKATPQAPSNKDCYLVAESGVCFGVAGCTYGDFLYYSSSPAKWNRVTPNSDIYAATTKVLAMWNEGWVYKGKALYTTNPGVPTAKVFYFNTLDSVARTYVQFGNEPVAANEFCLFKYDIVQDEWIKESIFTLPSGSTNLNDYAKVANNLSDLTNKLSARANLSVYSKAEIDVEVQQLHLQEQQDIETLTTAIADVASSTSGQIDSIRQSVAAALASEALQRESFDESVDSRVTVLENAVEADTNLTITQFAIVDDTVREVGDGISTVSFGLTFNLDLTNLISLVIRESRLGELIREVDLMPFVETAEGNHLAFGLDFDGPLLENAQFLVVATTATSAASKGCYINFIYPWFLGTEPIDENYIVDNMDLSGLDKRLNSKTRNTMTINGEGNCLCFACHNDFFFRIWLGGFEVTAFTVSTLDYQLPDETVVTYKLYKSDYAYNSAAIDVRLLKY
jgi:hypothetical protein